jgi:hypothetical protein
MGWIDRQIAKFIDVDRIAEQRFAAPAINLTNDPAPLVDGLMQARQALRALVGSSACQPPSMCCRYCGGLVLGEGRNSEMMHDHHPDCPYVAAQALIARLDESNPA